MDFGIVESTEVQNVDFTLPPDGEHTLTMFKDRQRSVATDLRIGLAKWGRKEWVGKFYPNRTKEFQFLHEYTKRFNTIELNAVFYSIPPENLIRNWKDMISPEHQNDFLFLPKFSRVISHIKRLSDAEKETEQFINTVKLFGQHLGPILLQIGDNFGPKKFMDLELFIKQLPTDQRFFIELRQNGWFSDHIERKAVFALFAQYNIGSVITDTPGRRDCAHMELTIPEVYIRFNGLGENFRTFDYSRIDNWVLRLKDWLESGLEKVYFIVSQKDEVDTPALARYAIERFNKELGAKIPLIVWDPDAPVTNVPMVSGAELLAKDIISAIEKNEGEIIPPEADPKKPF